MLLKKLNMLQKLPRLLKLSSYNKSNRIKRWSLKRFKSHPSQLSWTRSKSFSFHLPKKLTKLWTCLPSANTPQPSRTSSSWLSHKLSASSTWLTSSRSFTSSHLYSSTSGKWSMGSLSLLSKLQATWNSWHKASTTPRVSILSLARSLKRWSTSAPPLWDPLSLPPLAKFHSLSWRPNPASFKRLRWTTSSTPTISRKYTPKP